MSALVVVLVLLEFAAVTPLQAVAPARAAGPSPTLTLGFLEAVDSLNPFRGLNDPSYILYGLVYDYLFSFDQDGNLVPNLATSASCTDSTCQNWTYTIRQGVTWHDGSAFTAADVVFTINYNIGNFLQLWAFEPYVNRIVQCTHLTKPYCGAVQTAPWQVTVYFDRPFSPGKGIFIPIIEKAQWSGIPPKQAESSYQNPNPIGTGPFIADPNIYSEWSRPGTPLHLYRNPNYHPVGTHTGPSNITDIYLEQFITEGLMETALQNGQIDLGKFTSNGYDAIVGQPNILAQEGLLSTQYWNEIGFSQFGPSNSTTLNPTRYDINVRRALAMDTNKDYILQQFYGGKGWRGTDLMSYITPQWYYNPVADGTNLTFNVAAANQLLNQSGYTTWGNDPQMICAGGVRSATNAKVVIGNDNVATNDSVYIPKGKTLTYTMGVRQEFPQEGYTASYLQAQWCKVGVSIVIKTEAESALSTDVYGGALETYIWFWSGDPDPNYLLSIQSGFTLDGWNDNYWNNGTYNALYVAHLAALNTTTREQIVKQAQRLHYTSAVYLIYIYPYGEWGMRTDKWAGWGDWNAHPYRQMDAFWGANPLFLDLSCASCVVHQPPSQPTINGQASGATFYTYVNTSFGFTGQTTSPYAGATLTFDWHFGDNVNVTHSQPNPTAGAPVNDNEMHSYNMTGLYTVILTVSDGTASSPPTTVYLNVTTKPPTTGVIKGFVTDVHANPIVGATVSTNPASQSAQTNVTGQYTITAANRTYAVNATKAGFVSQSKSGVVLAAGATVWVNFSLVATPSGWVIGKITNTAGVSIASASISISGGIVPVYTVTDANGNYNKSLDVGNYSLSVTANGYVQQTRSGVVVVNGQATREDFQLTPTSTTTSSGLDPLVIAAIGLVAAVVVVAIAAVLLTRRRKKKEERESQVQLPPK